MASQVEPTARRASRASEMFRALSHPDFRWFWAGALITNAGTWMQTVAQGWLVLQMTNSPFWLGVDAFMATAPGLLLTLIGGVFADLIDRKRLLMITRLGAGLSAFILAALIVTDVVEVWMILVLTFATGCCMALAGPSYQALTFDLVGREDLANAVALNSSQFQLARVIGPFLAGVCISVFGMAGCFFVNGLTCVVSVATLTRMRSGGKEEVLAGAAAAMDDATLSAESFGKETAPARSLRDVRALWTDLTAGVLYVRQRSRVRQLLLCSMMVSLFGSPYLTMIPLFARDLFGWGANGLALMMGTAGAGALCGAILLAWLGDFGRKGWFVLGSALSASVCLIGFALATRPATSLLLLFGVGFSMVSFFAVSNTLLQYLVSDEMRGRVMSIWMLTFIGAMPFGNIISGHAAETLGAPTTLAAGGLVIAVFITFIIIFAKRLRSIN
ncbi:MAG TPA: MFS transporter [Pyrinomonadaceae bacterium]|nr:MFS transporter [Pyrinomonadaceae bacterium]